MSDAARPRFSLRLSPATRIALGLVVQTVALLVITDLLVPGFLAHPAEATRQSRNLLSQLTVAAVLPPLQAGNTDAVRRAFADLRSRADDLRSIALVINGEPEIVAGDHAANWKLAPDAPATLDQIRIPLLANGQQRGELQLAFEPAVSSSWFATLTQPAVSGTLLLIALAWSGSQFYLRREIRRMDPAVGVPERVRSAFDTLTEGVIILDRKGNVLLINATLQRFLIPVDRDPTGFPVSAMRWLSGPFVEAGTIPPWQSVLAGDGESTGNAIRIEANNGRTCRVIVNASPITERHGHIQGCLLTLNDVTDLEEKTERLSRALAELSASQAQIVAQNAELNRLATRDPLTNILNRRTLMAEALRSFELARQRSTPLFVLMCDIDHFKSINDQYGHAAGDRVIQATSRLLSDAIGDLGRLGRYGGEEFCAVFENLTLGQVLPIIEGARRAIEAEVGRVLGYADTGRLRRQVSMSFGVAGLDDAVVDPAMLIDHADQALYRAKHEGRNRIAFRSADGQIEVATRAGIETLRRDAALPSTDPAPSA